MAGEPLLVVETSESSFTRQSAHPPGTLARQSASPGVHRPGQRPPGEETLSRLLTDCQTGSGQSGEAEGRKEVGAGDGELGGASGSPILHCNVPSPTPTQALNNAFRGNFLLHLLANLEPYHQPLSQSRCSTGDQRFPQANHRDADTSPLMSLIHCSGGGPGTVTSTFFSPHQAWHPSMLPPSLPRA